MWRVDSVETEFSKQTSKIGVLLAAFSPFIDELTWMDTLHSACVQSEVTLDDLFRE